MKSNFKFICPNCSNEKLKKFTFRKLQKIDDNSFSFEARCLKCGKNSKITSMHPPPAKYTYPPPSQISGLYNSGLNLWTTDYCNRDCGFCLAKPWVYNNKNNSTHLSLSNLKTLVDWLVGSPLNNSVQIMGGEPLAHPHITELIQFLVDSPVDPKCILTNGLSDPRIIEDINKIKPDLKFCINVNHPDTYTTGEWETVLENIDRCHFNRSQHSNKKDNFRKNYRLNLAITLYKPDQPFDYIIDLAKKYEVSSIRYAPASPASDLSNNYVDFEKLKKIKPTLMRFLRKTVKNGIAPNLDCTLPPCLFSIQEWQFLIHFTSNVKSVCKPIFDLLPNLKLGYCACTFDHFGFFDLKKDNPAKKLKKIISQANHKRSKLLARCRDCSYFHNNICQGHCLRYK